MEKNKLDNPTEIRMINGPHLFKIATTRLKDV